MCTAKLKYLQMLFFDALKWICMVVTAEVGALECPELRREVEALKDVEVALETKALKWQLL